MSSPPNAFRSGDGMRRLEPGETFTGSWGITPVVAVR
jgi:aldose 1-epimerase